MGGDIMERLGKAVDFLDFLDIIPGGRADIEIKQNGKIIYEQI